MHLSSDALATQIGFQSVTRNQGRTENKIRHWQFSSGPVSFSPNIPQDCPQPPLLAPASSQKSGTDKAPRLDSVIVRRISISLASMLESCVTSVRSD